MSDEFDRLIDAWAAGERDPDQRDRLQQLLRDPANRQHWFDRCVEERALRDWSLASDTDTAASAPGRQRWPLLLAALVLLGLGLAWWRPWSTAVEEQIHLRVQAGTVTAAATDSRWPAPQEGQISPGSRLLLPAAAAIELTTADGVTASGRGPAELQLLQADRWHLVQGDLQVSVPPATPPTNFQVGTPHATAAVLGTRFHLVVDADGSTLTVDRGTVRWQPNDGAEQLVTGGTTVLAGHRELWRWQRDQGTTAVTGQLSDCWHLPSPPPTPARLLDEGVQVQPGRWCLFKRTRAALPALQQRLQQAQAITLGTRLRLPATDEDMAGLLVTQLFCQSAPQAELRYLQLRLPHKETVPTATWFDLERTVHRDGRNVIRIDGQVVERATATWQVDAWTEDIGLLLMESNDRLLDHPPLGVQAVWLRVH